MVKMGSRKYSLPGIRLKDMMSLPSLIVMLGLSGSIHNAIGVSFWSQIRVLYRTLLAY